MKPAWRCDHAGCKEPRRLGSWCAAHSWLLTYERVLKAATSPRKLDDRDWGKARAVKHDDGKTQWTLLPWPALEPVVRVLMHGASKYSVANWRLVLEAPGGQDRYFDAAMRHLVAWRGGEALDPESRLPHLAHAVCCLLFILTIEDET